MLEQLKDVEDYGMWLVLGVGAVALLVALRTTPTAGWALVGMVVGALAAPVVPPYGADADRFMTSVAIGAGAGMVIGATIGSAVGGSRAGRDRRPPRSSAVVLSRALFGGLIGLVGLGYGVALLDPYGPDLDLRSLFAAHVGWTLGWIVGAAIGWSSAERDDPRPGERTLLLILAGLAVIVAVAVAGSIRVASFGPMIDEVRAGSPKLVPTYVSAWIGSAVVVSTLLWLGLRPRGIASSVA